MAGMFEKATKKQAKLRLALFGVSGGGKTMSALRMGKGITSVTGGRIALIDTERKSACKYSDRFDFDVCEMDKATIENVILAMKDAKHHDVLIIDSLTHVWQELLQEVELIARTQFGGNTWAAWSKGTPKQQKFIRALLDFDGHVIATMRAETNWSTQINSKGKSEPVRIGEAPKQGKGIEYEFDMLMQVNAEHNALVLKDRTSKYQDQCIEIIDEDFGVSLVNWLSEGAAVINEKHKEVEEDEDVVNLEVEEPIKPKKSKKNLVVEEREDATDEEYVDEFKERIAKIANMKQVKLFMKQNDISVKTPESIKAFMRSNDLELTVALFLEEVAK